MSSYTFVSIAVKRGREGLTLDRDYQQVILEHAAQGWHFVQALQFESHTAPRLDLVFSRKDERQ